MRMAMPSKTWPALRAPTRSPPADTGVPKLPVRSPVAPARSALRHTPVGRGDLPFRGPPDEPAGDIVEVLPFVQREGRGGRRDRRPGRIGARWFGHAGLSTPV